MRESVLVSFVLAALLAGTPGASTATAVGEITGTVTGDQLPIETFVAAYRLDGVFVDSSRSGATGHYALSVPAGEFKVRFASVNDFDPSGTGFGWMGEWYSQAADFESATHVVVADGQTVTGIDADLAAGSAVTVTVRDAKTMDPVPNVGVTVFPSETFRYSGFADDDGVFRVSGLPEVQARVLFSDIRDVVEYRYEWFDEGDTFATATPVQLAASADTDVTMLVDEGFATISGTVTDQETGLGISQAPVRAYFGDDGISAVAIQADAGGDFALEGLRPGGYQILFDNWRSNEAFYRFEWFDDAARRVQATSVEVKLEETQTASAQLDYRRCAGLPATVWAGSVSQGVLTIDGTSGDDVIIVDPDSLNTAVASVTVNGLGGDDVICGSALPDMIHGGGGNDTIFGRNGSDTVFGGAGSDELYGGRGNDTLFGGNGAANGGDGADMIRGGPGRDKIWGGPRSDVIVGGDGADTLSGEGGGDVLRGGAGDADLVKGGNGPDRLFGGSGIDDSCRGGAGPDVADPSCEATQGIP